MSVLYSLGCDVAKDEHVVCLLRYDVASQQWQKIGQKTCKNTRASLVGIVPFPPVRRALVVRPESVAI